MQNQNSIQNYSYTFECWHSGGFGCYSFILNRIPRNIQFESFTRIHSHDTNPEAQRCWIERYFSFRNLTFLKWKFQTSLEGYHFMVDRWDLDCGRKGNEIFIKNPGWHAEVVSSAAPSTVLILRIQKGSTIWRERKDETFPASVFLFFL